MMLSEHFSTTEFSCIHCGLCHVEPLLIKALEELRILVGLPIKVLCGCRCVTHNSEIGGAKDSMHICGKAADIRINLPLKEFFDLCERVPAFKNGGIGIYPDEGFIHVDIREGKARWARVKGKYVSLDAGFKALKKGKT
jgi:uncharacterized protein YcbK (DUF882 family)